jgi:hypothetical protein
LSGPDAKRGRRGRGLGALGGALLLALAIAVVLAIGGGLRTAPPAAGQPGEAEAVPQTDASVPAHAVTMIGATPEEPGGEASETWGVGRSGTTTVVVRYGAGGWSLGPALQDAAGEPLTGFTLDASPLAGQMTRRGAGVLLGTVSEARVVLVRDPGGAFREVPSPAEAVGGEGEEPLLGEGEALFATTRAPLLAPLDEQGGGAGALLVPVKEAAGIEDRVLHWDGHAWSVEQIEVPQASEEGFRVLAIGASSPANGWLLGQLSSSASYPAGALALFRRVQAAGAWRWQPVSPVGGVSSAEVLKVPLAGGGAAPLTVRGTGEPPTAAAQLLTVTGDGVWIDGQRSDVHTVAPATTTLFFKAEGPAAGRVQTSWCNVPAGAEVAPCEHTLAEALPTSSGRSIAWADGSAYGQRVITGLPEGVSLRLQGESFVRMLALGGGAQAEDDPGARFGAAFASPAEGWLGVASLPVHLTTQPAPSRLTPWPAPFRTPLLAIAPQPGAAVGALSSEALAVGDKGAVIRFKPGRGWIPESLFGIGQKVEREVRLRSVAWPTSARAYAVGDHGQMWLWRGETGLWERDPATPANFLGNLLGVAFDPSSPARGYAVGTSDVGRGGVLLRYGKSWAQETSLPQQVQDAEFTSIAFAGSEAIVTYREQPNSQENHFVGGLLVNDGSGWRVDEGAAAALGDEAPSAVAGLPDGGAAFLASGGAEGPRIFERQGPGSPWQATPVPGLGAGSIALFREAGAVRAIVSGGGVGAQSEPQSPPPGRPPNYDEPLPPVAGIESGEVLRQTTTGWSDEGHELNPVGEQPGGYERHDLPYRPDPILAVLVDPSGGQGWAVGGELNSEDERLETGAIERYPADGVTPLGAGGSTVPGAAATIAIGGGAQCAGPCADRAFAGVGPDVWLRTALARARQIGARAFVYTGPYVTAGAVNGPRTVAIPFEREFGQYASILASSSPLPSFAAISPQELNARPEREGSEAGFQAAFAGFPEPFGAGAPAAGLVPAGSSPEQCAATAGCQAAYYALDVQEAGHTLRMVVLDDSTDVNGTQLNWLAAQLAGAASLGEAAIVVGNADLDAQVRAGDVQAEGVVRTLVLGGASAYFFDAPEENVEKPLRAGSRSIPAFGSGTLGYVLAINERRGDFHGASGFLLAQVHYTERLAAPNVYRVTARLIPSIGELALEAKGGILLRRSLPSLFAGLARRARAGSVAVAHSEEPETDPYIPIPANCVGSGCGTEDLLPEYEFSSSRPDVGDFVEPNLAVANNPLAVKQNAKGETVHDGQSGLFCPYNPGTTVVTVSAGGLSASLPVTVQAGSVRQPCGTVPLKELPAHEQPVSAPAPAPPSPAPAGAAPAGAPPSVPLPAPPALAPAALVHPAAPSQPFFLPGAPTSPLLAFVPPPVPTPARPTPPSGTSAVTSPIEVAEHEEEEEEATESVSNQAVAYRASDHEPSPLYIVGIVVLAAFAGASIRRPRRARRKTQLAPVTVATMRSRRRLAARRRWRP